ncbi:MAG: HAMP domain-containing histidine kinase [Myxococcales bacterium]|nr:HAMP domain-containing histidine kinase [Myxococcales bacterium]MCB9576072.1 HAMP domain-containing histidine kinase [Polyangiaceae bacterium]
MATTESDAARINFAWLVRVRWGAIFAQAAVIAAALVALGVHLPMTAVVVVLLAEVTSNALAQVWGTKTKRVLPRHVATLVATDIVLFTLLLYFTGGAANPFSFLYLVPIALAAHILEPRWTWALLALTVVCSGALFGRVEHAHHDHAAFGLHLQGMWLALIVAAVFIVYFMHRIAASLREREDQLAQARESAERGARLASLATLAAGAAHELATPLGTIAVVSKELTRRLQGGDPELLEDAGVIRSEVDRCRRILDRMATDVGQPTGEAPAPVTTQELIEGALAEVSERARVAVSGPVVDLCVPRHPVQQALHNLVDNALRATDGEVRIVVDGSRISVIDEGAGMSAEVLARATEPFFTSKDGGMGLGLFLVDTVAEQIGGKLELESKPGAGTRATLILPPCDNLPPPSAA